MSHKNHSVKRVEQSQASLNEQLWKLYELANKNGLYDAADFVKNCLTK